MVGAQGAEVQVRLLRGGVEAQRVGVAAGGDLGLADLHLAPMIGAFLHTPEAASVLQHHPNVQRWWGGMENRASMAATAPQLG